MIRIADIAKVMTINPAWIILAGTTGFVWMYWLFKKPTTVIVLTILVGVPLLILGRKVNRVLLQENADWLEFAKHFPEGQLDKRSTLAIGIGLIDAEMLALATQVSHAGIIIGQSSGTRHSPILIEWPLIQQLVLSPTPKLRTKGVGSKLEATVGFVSEAMRRVTVPWREEFNSSVPDTIRLVEAN